MFYFIKNFLWKASIQSQNETGHSDSIVEYM